MLDKHFWETANKLAAGPLVCEDCGVHDREVKSARVRVTLRDNEPVASNLALLCTRCKPEPKTRSKAKFAEIDETLQMSLFE